MAKLKHDATIGRSLIIDTNNPPDVTAEEFLSYMDEGFIPILRTIEIGATEADAGRIYVQLMLGTYDVGPNGVGFAESSITFKHAEVSNDEVG